MTRPVRCLRSTGRAVAWLVVLALPCAVASAAPKKDAGKELADQAADLFKRLEYLAAAELFERSFALNPEKLVRLRNAGRAFEEAGRLEHARHLFERYVQLAPAGTERTEVEQRLVALQARLAAAPPAVAPAAGGRAPAQPAARPPASTAPGAGAAPLGAGAAPLGAGAAPHSAGAAAAGSQAQVDVAAAPSKTPAWVVVATGTALTATGAVFFVRAAAASESVATHEAQGHYDYPGGAAKLSADHEAVAGSRSIAYTALGVGAAGLVGGIVWALWPPSPVQPARAPHASAAVARAASGAPASRAVLVPWVAAGGSPDQPVMPGASLAVRF